MKYKVGDKVKIRKDLVVDYSGFILITVEMAKLAGQVVTIESIQNGVYNQEETSYYNVNENGWGWADDMLEPVKDLIEVPKWFDDWYKQIGDVYEGYVVESVAIFALARQGFGYSFSSPILDKNQKWDENTLQSEYVIDHRKELIKAIIDGYTVKKIQKYEVRLKSLRTSDGEPQYLSKKPSYPSNFFASRRNNKLIQKFEYDEIPDYYKDLAKKVEEN